MVLIEYLEIVDTAGMIMYHYSICSYEKTGKARNGLVCVWRWK